MPVFLTYVLSFVYLGIYWNNHHHMLHAADRINGAILWANLHLLFWLSLVPFTTGWMGENHFAPLPSAVYGGVLLMCGVAYLILQTAIIRHQGPHSKLKVAVGHDIKGKISAVLYAAAILAGLRAPVDRRRDLRVRRADVARARPAHRDAHSGAELLSAACTQHKGHEGHKGNSFFLSEFPVLKRLCVPWCPLC